MEKMINNLLHDRVSLTGLILVAVSSAIFMLTGSYSTDTSFFGAFFINYMLSAGYLLVVWIHTATSHKGKLSKGKIQHTVFLLLLWFISAFALNREMNVFEDSVTWLSVWIVLSCVVLIVSAYFEVIGNAVKYIVFFFTGSALLLFTYYSLYLLPLYVIGLVGILAIGISLHTYVPFCLALVTIVIIIKAYKQDKKVLYMAISGFVLPIMFAVVFLINWSQTNRKINLIINQNTLDEGRLPAWVAVSQQIKNSPFAERILKTGLIYHEVAPGGSWFWGGMPSRSFDGRREHDPLVVLATLFFKKPNLDEREQINILKAMYNSRHQAQERLWSGDNLETISIISNVKLFPEYRLAYTEKTLTIKNNTGWAWNQQEAIYTFHLPEGAVVSSLSLWINGREEKSRLTTKAKADSAYQQVVGVEQHDPSVVHWQEGNTISVRVFPCTSQENRKFRIGITSPLSKQGNHLVYDNVFFDGPQAANALETTQISFSEKPMNLKMPSVFKQAGVDRYISNSTYEPNWQIACDAPALKSTGFTFGGARYQVSNYRQQYEAFTPDVIYLDVNSSWTKDEFKQVYTSFKKQPVYIYYDKLVKLTDANADELFDLLKEENFSLFPVNKIGHPATALLVSKSTDTSPNLNDLVGSGFAEDMTAYLKHQPGQIRLFNIGYQLSPYLKALKELRVFNYANGSLAELSELLDKHRFIHNAENSTTVVISSAGLIINKGVAVNTGHAPDHILRLFAYNDIMKQVAAGYFNENEVPDSIVAEAEQAYVVSPVSSLIVLETPKDYERFGIEENKNSLQNASMKSSGAVPEPQEWLLILLAASVVIYMVTKQKIATQKL
ncbi:XrtN system VIT domain-containing protein [Mucilaginibacter segetis]|uniref:XrtN system VIT domain-containing protein n=1 Tax=Mucilaginibacter segetis TaxID=2793071 RepID=A0A934PX04_9SPHI|nr:XrtN system VIT domain-containing protein [Mucilaginibacter segetis]MBK0380705.1 XrtN system VIT domain-containing protein [Mucilaginibacter segetis]